MSHSSSTEPLFREVQKFSQPLLWMVLIASVGIVGAFFGVDAVRQLSARPPGGPLRDPLLFFMGLAGFTVAAAAMAFIGLARLETEVRPGEIVVRFFPLHRKPRRIPIGSIASFEARTYRPILDYGGWGLRCSHHGWVYNVRGNRGVQLVFGDGKRLLIGSQRADELARAIEAARGPAAA